MSADAVLLPLCVGLSLLGVIATGIAWRRGNKGRVVQGVGLALAPVALYLTGLLGLVWDGVAAVFRWAGGIVFSPPIWIGFSLLGLCIVLWVVGGILAPRIAARKPVEGGRTPGKQVTRGGATKPAKGDSPQGGTAKGQQAGKGQQADPVDDEMAEIEALLKSRGIE
ncbi:MAG: hypothetical protein ACTH2Q_20470 [Propionibacteriaceae bacterium]